MGSLGLQSSVATDLGSPESRFRLNQIDKVRAHGVGSHVSLPQLVVCGDQSAGKSSVLERLTDIPFPRKEGLCTRFATEIILRHSVGPQEIVATIRTDASRESNSKRILNEYRREISDFADLPGIIEEVSALMGLRGPEAPDGPAFARDALRIEVCGPTGLHFTIVDLPGLISVENEDQTGEDVEIVHSLVGEYLRSSRTIILAVVQAGNDIANQPIIRKAKTFDPEGIRTVGIITKPDLINDGTEHIIARLANNEGNIKLKLGFFVLKNPSPKEMEAGFSSETLNRIERDFFNRDTWLQRGINLERVGLPQLKSFLQLLLHSHIEREIPKVQEDLKKKLSEFELQLEELGTPRPTLADIRAFLIERSMRLHQLAQNSLQGYYLGADSEFFQLETRLRTMIHEQNTKFSETMRVKGAKRVAKKEPLEPVAGSSELEPLRVTRKEMMNWATQIYRKTRGLELPGNYNHILLAELFQEQSSGWIKVAEKHIEVIIGMVRNWLTEALRSTIREEAARREITSLCHEKLEETAAKAKDELDKLWQDEQRQPITYNHYYTDNVGKQQSRPDIEAALRNAISEEWNGKFHVSNQPEDIARLAAALQNRFPANMDDVACKDALDGMEAYYKVARKTFVDNVCRQVVERQIIVPLPTFFSPTTVSQLSDAEVLRIGSETDDKKAIRERLSASAECLRLSLRELCMKPDDRRGSGGEDVQRSVA